MKKIEMEQLLMRPERISVLTERADYLKNKYGENGATGGMEADRVAVVKQMPHEILQTTEEIKANDHDVVARSELMPDLTQFIPDYTESEPRTLLRTLCKKYRDNPSLSEQLIIENVINKITSIGQVDRDDEKVIGEAIQVLVSAGGLKDRDTSETKSAATKREEG
ncbi:MAG: hypothetical protein JRE64_10745 [Deltaproteobacteria bacterium]|jgi:hypothetical protein|nr:hypothetical protein [Deltaproteobacteria bacterium]